MPTAYLLETVPARVTDDNGDPVAGALLYSYEAGTATPLATYTDSTGNTPLSNPVVADGDGNWVQIWVSSASYKFIAREPDTTLIFQRDNVRAPSGIAEQLRADLANAVSAINGASLVGYNPALAYAAATVGASLKRRISVGDYAATGLSDPNAFLAALAEAKARISSNSALSWFGVGIHVPGDRNWDLNGLASALAIDKSGISFYGDPGRGGRIIRNGTIFDVGDYTNTNRVTMFGLRDLVLDAGVGNNATAGIKLYRTQETRFYNVTTLYFDIHYDLYRASTTRFMSLRPDNTGRTVNATAFIRMQGLDETQFASPSSYTPGGGLHFSDIEAHHDGGAFYTTAFLQIYAVDGLYGNQAHCTGCAHFLQLIPDASPENYVATDIHLTECYFDNAPAVAGAANVQGFYLGGTVDPTITMDDGSSKASIYNNIWLLQCYSRGAYNQLNAFLLEVSDPGGAFFIAGESVQDVKIHGGEYTGSTQTGIRLKGATTGAFFEIDGWDLIGATVGDNNQSATANIGSAVNAEISSGSITSNTFKPDGATSYTVRIIATNNGAGDDAGAALVAVNTFAGTTPTVQDVFYNTAGGAKVEIIGNLASGPGQRISQRYSGRTTDRSPLIVWQQTIQEGQVANLETSTIGSSVTGTLGSERTSYRQRMTLYRQQAGSATVQAVADVTTYDNVTNNDATINLTLLNGTAWVASAAKVARDLVTSGGNLYLALLAGNLDATNPPVHTSGVVTNGTVPLGYVSAVAANSVALIVSGASAESMSWSGVLEANIVP